VSIARRPARALAASAAADAEPATIVVMLALDRPADNATCPRCRAVFHCGARDDAPCACSAVTLDASTLQWLRERYTGCLCLSCLRALGAAAVSAPPGPSTVDPPE
jgi:hypothetical protein